MEAFGQREASDVTLHALDGARRLLRTQQAVSSHLTERGDTEEALRRVLATLCDGLGWALGAVWQHAGEEGVLHCSATWAARGTSAGAVDALTPHRALALGEGLPGKAWDARRPLWVADVATRPDPVRPALEPSNLRAHVAFPMLVEQRFEGVVELLRPAVCEPDEELIAWLSAVGGQLGQFLDRARVHATLVMRDRALAATASGVVIADATVRGFPILYANPGFERLTGYAEAEVLGRPCSILQGAETDPLALEEIAHALRHHDGVRTTLLNYRKDGTRFWNEVVLSPVCEPDGRLTQYIGVQDDVSQRRQAEEHVAYLSFHDPLTGLANRALLAKHLKRAIDRAQRYHFEVALLYLDLDLFQEVNERQGHAAGDQLLWEVAGRLRHALPAGDLIVRQGGDEFLVLLADIDGDGRPHATRAAERMTGELGRPVVLPGGTVHVTASIGISVFGQDADSAEAMLQHADAAMDRAKRSGGGGHRLYSAGRRGGGRSGAAAGGEAALEEERSTLEQLLAGGGVHALYQPIVDIETRTVVAYEALGRGPRASPLEFPDALFRTARVTGRLAELDWACRGAAFAGALRGTLGQSRALFVNVEPEALVTPCPDHLTEVFDHARSDLPVVVEITERALTARPAELLHGIARMRELGWGIALDDVGADTRSLALMPLLRPDVIKLDLRLVQEQPSTEIAEIVNAVNAQHERTGAIVLAEGIETERHLATARAMGATLAQGWHFGRPGPLPSAEAPIRGAGLVFGSRTTTLEGATPYERVRSVRPVRAADKRLLLSLSFHLEHQAAALSDGAVVLSAFQSAERFTERTHRRYSVMAAEAAFVAALGVGMDEEPAPGVRGAALGPEDPLLGEWSVVVLGPHFAAALVAQDLGDDGPEMDRRFTFALTYDRELVIDAASALMERVLPLG